MQPQVSRSTDDNSGRVEDDDDDGHENRVNDGLESGTEACRGGLPLMKIDGVDFMIVIRNQTLAENETFSSMDNLHIRGSSFDEANMDRVWAGAGYQYRGSKRCNGLKIRVAIEVIEVDSFVFRTNGKNFRLVDATVITKKEQGRGKWKQLGSEPVDKGGDGIYTHQLPTGSRVTLVLTQQTKQLRHEQNLSKFWEAGKIPQLRRPPGQTNLCIQAGSKFQS
ncbi:uncharacterized protein [Henckelia pumila]|uniref:uncharacterized protein n=1 Tax=Henckelia pumila TaxID=405737 RepID=UPI003C6E917A